MNLIQNDTDEALLLGEDFDKDEEQKDERSWKDSYNYAVI